MSNKIPNTPFSTRLSGSAKETELRLRSIFQWKKKRPPVILFVLVAILLLGVCGGLVGFSSTPCSGLMAQVYPEYFSENSVDHISYFDKNDYGYPYLERGSENFAAAMEYLGNTEVRAVLGHKRHIGDFNFRNGAFTLAGESKAPLTIELYPDGYVVISESWGLPERNEKAKVYRAESFNKETFLSYWELLTPEEDSVKEDAEPEPGAELEEPKPEVRYTAQRFAFPGSTLWTAFTVQLEWPEGWQIDDYDGSGEPGEDLSLSREAIYGADGSLIGTIGYNTFEPYEGEIDPELYYQTVYSGIRLGAHYFWEDFSFVAATDGGETHRATVYYQKDNGGSAASWPAFEADGICSYDKELAVYVAFEFKDGAVEDEVLFHIAQSIRLEPVEEPVDMYETNGHLATVVGISHMLLDELPREILDSLTLVSETDLSEMYQADWGWRRIYTAPGLEITTTAPSAAYLEWREEADKNNRERFPTEEDFYAYIEREEGQEWLIGVTITDDKYVTLDGLRVGLTCAQAAQLGYSLHEGENQIGNEETELQILVENDTVVSIRTMGRYIGKFFEQ